MAGPTTVAGTAISISAAHPATYDVTGYAALTYTKIGEVTDGGSHGKTFNEVTHSPIDNRAVQKYKGSFNNGTKTLTLAIDPADAGQILAKAALDSDADYSFKVLYPDLSADYFQAKVMSFAKATAGVDSMRSATINLSITATKTGIGIIEAPIPV